MHPAALPNSGSYFLLRVKLEIYADGAWLHYRMVVEEHRRPFVGEGALVLVGHVDRIDLQFPEIALDAGTQIEILRVATGEIGGRIGDRVGDVAERAAAIIVFG